MFDEKRIKEAENNVRSFLEDGFLIKVKENIPKVKLILLKNAQESLEMANHAFKNQHHLWTIICSYYSMFYISNAILYDLGYKTADKIVHKVTADALIVFVRNKLKKKLINDYEEAQNDALAIMKADEMIYHFDKEREKRGRIQYSTTETAKHSKAKTSLERARNYYKEMYELIYKH